MKIVILISETLGNVIKNVHILSLKYHEYLLTLQLPSVAP